MAKEGLGGMGWLLVGIAAYVVLQKKGVAQAIAPTQAQLSQASMLPNNPVAGSDSYTAWVQTSLNYLLGGSVNLAVDGVMGPITRAAVMSFQGLAGLPQTGIVDSQTDWMIRTGLGQQPYASEPYPGSIEASVQASGEY
jgi:peptidoglycan hydrolase-like protein with peptidoglycan-binding domain